MLARKSRLLSKPCSTIWGQGHEGPTEAVYEASRGAPVGRQPIQSCPGYRYSWTWHYTAADTYMLWAQDKVKEVRKKTFFLSVHLKLLGLCSWQLVWQSPVPGKGGIDLMLRNRPMGRERACSLTVLTWNSFDLGEVDSSVLPEAYKNLFKFTVCSSPHQQARDL